MRSSWAQVEVEVEAEVEALVGVKILTLKHPIVFLARKLGGNSLRARSPSFFEDAG
jgi:hypothetical protein